MSRSTQLAFASALAISAATLSAAPPASAQDDGEPYLQPLIQMGETTLERPEVGVWNNCTATRVSQRMILTAAHCFDYASVDFRNSGDAPVFTVEYADGTSRDFATLSTVSLVNGLGPSQDDVMLVAVAGMDDTVPIAPIATGLPAAGAAVTYFGYGCTNRATLAGGGTKRKADLGWGPTMVLCPGDSGGAVFNAAGEIVGVNSGFDGGGTDILGDPIRRRLALTTTIDAYEERSWVNEPLCATERNPYVTALYGDIDGNGMVDAFCNAKLAPNGYTYVRKGAYGRYEPGDVSRSVFCTHATAELHLGDFNGDRRMDLMCHDTESGWRVVDFADVGPTPFRGQDYVMRDHWCSHDSAEVHLGDFDGDGRTDLLCHDTDNGRKWYIYTATDTSALFDPSTSVHRAWGVNWCSHDTARVLTGDVDGDGVTDAICHTQNSGAVDVAFHRSGDRDGGFPGTSWFNHGLSFCTNAEATVRVMDYNLDGRADLICEAPVGDDSEGLIAQARGAGRTGGVYQRTDAAGRTGFASQVVSRWQSGFVQPTIIQNPAANPWQRPR